MQPEGRIPGKPLGGKAYGSTPHLPTSRLGPGDWSINAGQARILTEKAREGDEVWVTEKLDGSCCAAANIGGEIVALNRAGFRAETSPWEHHRLFAEWVRLREARLRAALRPGEWIVGEWLMLAHGIRYEIAEPRDLFVVFAAFRHSKRMAMREMMGIAARAGLREANVLARGGPCPVEVAISDMGIKTGVHGAHGAQEPPEGAVWVVERHGAFDFAAKWVQPDKVDGKLLPEISGSEPIWNWHGSLAPSGQETMPACEAADHV